MSEASCPVTGSGGSICPVGRNGMRMGPRGCAFAAYQMSPSLSSLNPIPHGQDPETYLRTRERKTINELLMPEAPALDVTKGLKNADNLNPKDTDVLAAALGAPARQVLMRAEEVGPRTGWKDGYLSVSHGFCPPDPSASPIALALSAGRVWSDLCERMPGVVARGKMRESILQLPLIVGTSDIIPDDALWAATVCLGILCSVYRYEERNDGHEGITVTPPPGAFKNLQGEEETEEELKGIPRNIAVPFRQVCTRMGRPLPHLTQFDVSVYNFKLRDPTSVHPYLPRRENMDLRWPVFRDNGEANFLLIMAESHGCTIRAVDIIARCQEYVMTRNVEGLLQELIKLKEIVDQLPNVFHKISVNPNSGENFANPVEWGQRYAKFSAPLSKRVPALSGLALPPFLLLDAFLGRTKYDSFLGAEALHLRAWLPMNIRAFIAAVEYHYQVPAFVKESGDPRLIGVLEGIVESYAGERGFMGTHRYKVYGFLEVVAKTGRTETNGNAGGGDDAGRPWEEVHRTLSESMKERLHPFRESLSLQPHQMRGTFNECRFKSRLLSRSSIDRDPNRSTAMVTFDLQDTGITFQPGDRLAIMPLNCWIECAKVAAALGLEAFLENPVPLDRSPEWAQFAIHMASVSRTKEVPKLTVKDILRRGHLAPLTKDLVMALHGLFRASSATILKVLATEEWPVRGSLGDLLQIAVNEVSPQLLDQAFSLSDLSWLPRLVPVEVPRTYSISNFTNEFLPSTVDLTVSRSDYKLSPLLSADKGEIVKHGVSSGFLNSPQSQLEYAIDDDEILVGLSRPLNFQLPISQAAPIAMFAGGSGIAPFRSFWQARRGGVGRNILFLGVQSRERFSHEEELREYVQAGQLEVHTAFSRDSNGLVYDPMSRELVEKRTKPRYIDAAIIEQGQTVCDLVMSKSQGGLGGYIYICGSVAVYDTVMKGIRQAIYDNRTATKESADALIATAFAERRFMLDIFMTPKPISYNSPTVAMSELAKHTGHRPGSRMWIGVHGGVYDITDFLPIHPGGTLIVGASAGLDATKTFDELAHTNNPEVSSLLTKYFIGHLAGKPNFRSGQISELYNLWYQYLRSSVETLTGIFFEVNNIMEDSDVWFQGSLLNMAGVRKFYQFQSRLMQNGFSNLFGAKLQELYLKLSFALVSSATPDTSLPDVIGAISRAGSSPAATASLKEISQIGQFVCNSQGARFQENGILKYAQTVTKMDVQFLEDIREEICAGIDAFDVIESLDSVMEMQRTIQLSAYLIGILERMAKKLDSFYAKLAEQSIYRPEFEINPARTRWNGLKRRIRDGSFFVLTRELKLENPNNVSRAFQNGRRAGDQDIDFTQLIMQTKRSMSRTPTTPAESLSTTSVSGRKTLADYHTRRALASTSKAPSSFEIHEEDSAMRRMESFMGKNIKAIRRLSRIPPGDTSLAHLMSSYGKMDESIPAVPPLPTTLPPPAPPEKEKRDYWSTRNPSSNPTSDMASMRSRSSSRTNSTERGFSSYSTSSRGQIPQIPPLNVAAKTAPPPQPPPSAISSILSSISFAKRPSAPQQALPNDLTSHDSPSSAMSDRASVRSRRAFTNDTYQRQNSYQLPSSPAVLKDDTRSINGSLKSFRLPVANPRGVGGALGNRGMGGGERVPSSIR